MSKKIIRFQENDDIDAIVADGSWEFAEHLLRQYGDDHGFVPNRRSKIISKSDYIFISYIGTMSKTGQSGILYTTDHTDGFDLNSLGLYQDSGEEELIAYTIEEWLCDEEDWRESE